jgi:hypothetical protein
MYFFRGKSYALIMTKSGFPYIFGDYFANTSGRPGYKQKQICILDFIFTILFLQLLKNVFKTLYPRARIEIVF